MRKTPSNYVQDIERNGRKITVIRGFEGKDYLEKWAETAEAEDARLAQPYTEKIEKIEIKPTPQLKQTVQIEIQELAQMPKTPKPKPSKTLF